MKKHFLKLISLALALALCCVFLPTHALAAENITNLSFDFNDLATLPGEIISGTIVDDPAAGIGFTGKSVMVNAGSRFNFNSNLALQSGRTYKFKFYLYPTIADWYGIVSNVWSAEQNNFVWNGSVGTIAQKDSGSPRLPDLTAGVWNLVEFTYTPDIDRAGMFFNFVNLGVYYIDDLEITDITNNQNTAVSQRYDFDHENFVDDSGSAYTSTSIVDRNGQKSKVRVINPTGGNGIINAKLGYPIESGKYYKLTYDYKGTTELRVLHCMGEWSATTMFNTDAINENGSTRDNGYKLDSGTGWKTYDTIFYAEQASTHLYFMIANGGAQIMLDNITLVQCDASGSETTAFPAKHVVDFDDDSIDSLNGVASNSNYSIVSDPYNSQNGNKVLKHTGGYSAFYIPEIRLLSGHEYLVTYDFYYPVYDSANNGIRLGLKAYNGTKSSSSTTVVSGGWATFSADGTEKWHHVTKRITNANGGDFIQLFVKSEIYIDNIVIRDLTPDKYASDYEDEEIFYEDETSRTEVTYVQDDEYGKVAQISYSPVSGLGGYTKFPVRLKDGEAYKVTFTYKTDGWATVHYASKTTPALWALSATSTWKTATYYVTGTGNADYFGFRCNNATDVLNIQIANVTIERQTYAATTDINADGVSNTTDFALLRSYLLTGCNDLKFFEKYTEQNGVSGVDICDLVAMNIAVPKN